MYFKIIFEGTSVMTHHEIYPPDTVVHCVYDNYSLKVCKYL